MYFESIHLFVELLDQFFGNVCELDLVFNFNKVRWIFLEAHHYVLLLIRYEDAASVSAIPLSCVCISAGVHDSGRIFFGRGSARD